MGIGVIAREVRLGCGPGPDGVHAVCAAGVRGRAEPAARKRGPVELHRNGEPSARPGLQRPRCFLYRRLDRSRTISPTARTIRSLVAEIHSHPGRIQPELRSLMSAQSVPVQVELLAGFARTILLQRVVLVSMSWNDTNGLWMNS